MTGKIMDRILRRWLKWLVLDWQTVRGGLVSVWSWILWLVIHRKRVGILGWWWIGVVQHRVVGSSLVVVWNEGGAMLKVFWRRSGSIQSAGMGGTSEVMVVVVSWGYIFARECSIVFVFVCHCCLQSNKTNYQSERYKCG